jgi:hypothetical protein
MSYWSDLIDPCSGHPIYGVNGASIYNEVDSAQALLLYPSEQVCQCAILRHPIWSDKIYPASILTICPLSVLLRTVEQVLEELEKNGLIVYNHKKVKEALTEAALKTLSIC